MSEKISETRSQTGLGVLAAKGTAVFLQLKRPAAVHVTIATGPDSKLIKISKGVHWPTVSFVSAHTTLDVWVGEKGGGI